MSTVTLELPDETRRRLEDKAARSGQPLEAYLRVVLEAAAGRVPTPAVETDETPVGEISVEEFERRLDALTDGLPPIPPLPDDFSRADIYDD